MKEESTARLDSLLSTLAIRCAPQWLDDGNEVLNSSQFVDRTRSRAEEIARENSKPGTRRLIEASGSSAYFVEMCATWLAGCVFCPVEPGLPEAHLREIRTLLGQEERTGNSSTKGESTVLLTSGSTGTRKGVRLSLAALLDNAMASAARLGIRVEDRLMINIPFHFTSAICHFLACLVSGASLNALARPLFARDLVDRVREIAPSGFGGAPLQARWLADGLGSDNTLQWLMTSGDDLSVSTRQLIAARLPNLRVHVFYGLTEVAGRLTSLHPDDRPEREGSVGKAIDGLSVEVLDASGTVCPPGELGEVHASGRTLMLGYIGREGRMDASGRFATGDIGWKDDSGFLYLAGRSDDVFKVSGTKVSGLAVRNALLHTGLVADAFVIPFRLRSGLVVAGALVTPIDGQTIDLAVLRAMARTRVETHEQPREYIVVDRIPRTGSGKPDRRAIDGLLESLGWRREHGQGVFAAAQ